MVSGVSFAFKPNLLFFYVNPTSFSLCRSRAVVFCCCLSYNCSLFVKCFVQFVFFCVDLWHLTLSDFRGRIRLRLTWITTPHYVSGACNSKVQHIYFSFILLSIVFQAISFLICHIGPLVICFVVFFLIIIEALRQPLVANFYVSGREVCNWHTFLYFILIIDRVFIVFTELSFQYDI